MLWGTIGPDGNVPIYCQLISPIQGSLVFLDFFLQIFKIKVYPLDPLNPPSAKKEFGLGVMTKPIECRLENRIDEQNDFD
jgi:hypothetical protein